MDASVKVTFDSEYRVRVLEESKFKKSEELEKESTAFLDKIGTFSEKVSGLVELLESHATRIDAQKLKAIGLRMAAENEAEQRQKQERALRAVINEKRAELDRYVVQHQSLERIESEQKSILEKLTSSDPSSSSHK